jgi:sterol desaturase/sphingolipid hydroxylase (fatty acid hydroxylase superfamily)
MPSLAEFLPVLFRVWSMNAALDIGRYLIAAFGMALILKLFWRAGLARRKIQAREATGADRRREIATSLRTALIFSVTGVLIFLGAVSGVLTVYRRIGPHGIPYLVLSVIGLILAHDTYFYWTHRMMHHPKLFRWFHRTHHRSITPTPFTAYAFDVPEAIVQSLIVPLWLLAVPMHTFGLFLFMAFMIVRNVMGHAGVELFPRAVADSRWFGWLNATTHHDLHHSSFRYNYGLYFTWWDRLMGTEHPQYRTVLRGRPDPALPAGAYIPAGTSD